MENTISSEKISTQPLRVDVALAEQLQGVLQRTLAGFPWCIKVTDWTGRTYPLGGTAHHWSGLESMNVAIKTPQAGHDLLALNGMAFMERFLAEEVDITGNLYLFPEVRGYARMKLTPLQVLTHRLRNMAFQSPARAKKSVQSHYDIPEDALFYLDRVYRSYSCGMWERPSDLNIDDALTIGKGEHDTADTLEKAQWRKFADAADYLAPKANESILDIGAGYGGFMRVAMERYPGCRTVGWTHSENQVREGKQLLADCDSSRFELLKGDYREEKRVFDHAHSTGMVCHVGPKGLVPYVRNVRAHIKTGGRYLHHVMMTVYTGKPLFSQIGLAFNAKYVWPGFYYFTLGDHIRALEENGFRVVKMVDLAPHYAKTTRAWYERMMQQKERFAENTSESTLRAWQAYLAGGCASFLNRHIVTGRLYCEAIEISKPSPAQSDPVLNPATHLKHW